MIESTLRALRSAWTGTLLIAILVMFFAVFAWVPQGHEAVALARQIDDPLLRTLGSLGLTHVLSSWWLWAIFTLFFGHFVSRVLVRDEDRPIEPKGCVPHVDEWNSSRPEHVVGTVRRMLLRDFGPEEEAKTDGETIELAYRSGTRNATSVLWTELGLLILVAAALGLGALGFGEPGVARSKFVVTDKRTGAVGHFDMVEGEPVRFFGSSHAFVVRDFAEARGALGPAIRLVQERSGAAEGEVWIYADAPQGFDGRHRVDEYAIESVWMGRAPRPGEGPANSVMGVIAVVGLACIAIGVFFRRQPVGRIRVTIAGDRVRVVGMSARDPDPSFKAAFLRWTARLRAQSEAS